MLFTNAGSIRYLSSDDKDQLEWKILIESNNLDEDRITSDPKYKNNYLERLADFSDEESDADDSDRSEVKGRFG